VSGPFRGAGSENAVDILEPVPRLLRDLGTSTCGLSAREAARRSETPKGLPPRSIGIGGLRGRVLRDSGGSTGQDES
jgi:hypothetical protein